MADKQYISPIRLFEELGIDYAGEPDITRIKKHLAAEFNQSKTGFIEINDHTYNRNDVMEEIERPDFKTRMGYHIRLWGRPFLLAMLESNEANRLEVRVALNSFQNDNVFDEFFSPYFAGPFNNITRACINNNDLAEVGEWLAFESFLLPAEREDGFAAIRIFLDESLRMFRNINKDNFQNFRQQFQPWLRWGWHSFMNNLPHEYYHYREQIVSALINLTVAIQKTNKTDCRNISNDLVLVKDLPEELQRIISNNDRAFNASPSTSSSSGNYWWLVWVVIIFIRLVTSGGCLK